MVILGFVAKSLQPNVTLEEDKILVFTEDLFPRRRIKALCLGE